MAIIINDSQLTYNEWDQLCSFIEHAIRREADRPYRDMDVLTDLLDVHGDLLEDMPPETQ